MSRANSLRMKSLTRRDLLRLSAAGAVGLSSASFLAACGGSNNGSSTKVTVVSGGAAASQATARGTVASAPSTVTSVAGTPRATSTPASGTLSYFSEETADTDVAWYNVLNAALKKTNPDIVIEAQYLSTGKDFFPKLQTALAAHSPPDFIPRNGFSTAYTMWSQGVLDPADDLIQTIGVDKFSPAALDAMKEGKNYIGVPFDVVSEILYYRTDLAQQAGLKPPTNWTELLTFAKTLTKGGVYGFVLPFGNTHTTSRLFLSFLRQNGGNIVDPDLKVVFDSPAVVEALDFIKELSQYSPPGSATYGAPEMTNAFYTGQAASVKYGGRVISEAIAKNPSLADKLGAVQPPYSKMPFAFAAPSSAQVFKEAKRKDLAKLWITKFQYDLQIYLQWMNVLPGQYLPLIPAVAQLPEYINNSIRQKYPDIIKQLTDAVSGSGDFTKESPKHKLNPHAGELDDGPILVNAVQQVLVGGQSSKSVVTATAKLIEALMKG
jgi:multiple sugar transport system substrate-binding protein